jgi:hypothetical protein
MAGKANRKHGRNKRSPSSQRYTNERRWEKNAKRRQAQHATRLAKKARHMASRKARGLDKTPEQVAA